MQDTYINMFIEKLMAAFDPEDENGRDPSTAEHELVLSYLDTNSEGRETLLLGKSRKIYPTDIEELLDLIEAAGISTFTIAEDTDDFWNTRKKIRSATINRSIYIW